MLECKCAIIDVESRYRIDVGDGVTLIIGEGASISTPQLLNSCEHWSKGRLRQGYLRSLSDRGLVLVFPLDCHCFPFACLSCLCVNGTGDGLPYGGQA